jgi:hypothetical protein
MGWVEYCSALNFRAARLPRSGVRPPWWRHLVTCIPDLCYNSRCNPATSARRTTLGRPDAQRLPVNHVSMNYSWIHLARWCHCRNQRISSQRPRYLYSFVILTNITRESPTVSVRCRCNLLNLAEYIEMDSHCPEAAALFSALCFVWLTPLDKVLARSYHWQCTTITLCSWQQKRHRRWPWVDIWQETSAFDYLKSDYDLLQGIQRELESLPIASNVKWVEGHQDWHKLRKELPLKSKANCIADDVCTETYHWHPSEVGHVPDWIPETKAALLHHGKVIAKKQDDYVTTAAAAPQLRKCLIKKSKRHNPLIEQDWDATTTFTDIDWKGMQSSLLQSSHQRPPVPTC